MSYENSRFSLRKHRNNEARSVKGYNLQEKKRSLTNSILDMERQKQKQRSFAFNPESKESSPTPKNNNSGFHHAQNKFSQGEAQKSNAVNDPSLQTNSCRFAQLSNSGSSKLHDSELCVCDSCTCGRHLCNLHVTNKPKIHHNSLYKRDYNRKGLTKHIMPLKHAESPSIQGKITPCSTYGKDFYNKARSVDSRIKPEDCIESGGPLFGVTTYSNGFVDFKKQFVYPKGKNTGGETVTNLPFVGNSTYRKEYSNPKKNSSFTNEVRDNLRMGDTFFGYTTYTSNFPKHDTSYSTSAWSSKDLAQNNPDFKHQYETTYKNDYLKSGNSVCPAKMELQTKSKGFFKNSKGFFQQNSDFKSFDPEFHALSTAKVI